MSEQVKTARWRELQRALFCVNNADFEIGRGNLEAGAIWLDDARRAIGAVALLCGADPDAEGYARLLNDVLAHPHSTADAAYIERQGRDQS